MAVIVAWVEHWAVVAISLSALLAIVGFLAFCICLDYNRKRFRSFYAFNNTISAFMIRQHPKNEVIQHVDRVEDVRRVSKLLESEETDTCSFDGLQLVIEDTEGQ